MSNSVVRTCAIQQSLMEVGPFTERIIPDTYWSVALGHRTYNENQAGYQDLFYTQFSVPAKSGETLGEAALRAYNAYGSRTSYAVYAPQERGCIGYGAYSGSADGNMWSRVMVPPGACVSMPPTTEWCNVTAPSVVLDHGVVTVNANPVTTADNQLQTECSTPMTVRISFGEDLVSLGGGLQAQLTVPGDIRSLPSGVSSVGIRSTINLKSTTPAGTYSGATVAFIDYY
jgi:hypothetical protein